MQVLWAGTEIEEDELLPLLKCCRSKLFEASPFVLLLDGGMGAGKTTFVRHFLQSLGLPEATPVTSPTYTILNEYRIGEEWFAHLDFYRIAGGAELEEMDVLQHRPFRGFFVEWPQHMARNLLQGTHRLRIAKDDVARSYCLEKL